MTVQISSDAEKDIDQGYWYYEEHSDGLGRYFRDGTVCAYRPQVASRSILSPPLPQSWLHTSPVQNRGTIPLCWMLTVDPP